MIRENNLENQSRTQNQIITDFAAELISEKNGFKKDFMVKIATMSDEEWKLLERKSMKFQSGMVDWDYVRSFGKKHQNLPLIISSGALIISIIALLLRVLSTIG